MDGRPSKGESEAAVDTSDVEIEVRHKTRELSGETSRTEKRKGIIKKYIGKAGPSYRKFGLKHVVWFLLLTMYALLGGGIFRALEHDEEILEYEKKDQLRNESAQNVTDDLLLLLEKKVSREDVLARILQFQEVTTHTPQHPHKPHFDFWGSVFYSATVFTTIGYGHYATQTTQERVATMIYALFGVPLMLATLSAFGKLLAKGLRHFWRKTTNAFYTSFNFCINKLRSNYPDLADYDYWDKKRREEEGLDVPIVVAILFLVGWVFLSAGFFQLWEGEWSYFTSVYFCFISLTTIGLGDVTPEHPKLMLAGFMLVLVGLSLISLVLSLIQSKIENLKESSTKLLEKELGWKKPSQHQPHPFYTRSPTVATLGIFGSSSFQPPLYTRNSIGIGRKTDKPYFSMLSLNRLHSYYSSPTKDDYIVSPTSCDLN